MLAKVAVVACLLVLSVAGRKSKPSNGGGGSSTTTTAAPTTTTAASSGDNGGIYADQIKALIDAGTCASLTTSTSCGTDADAESYYDEFVYNGKRVVVVSGAPNHAAEQESELLLSDGFWNPNTRCSIWQFIVLPLEPTNTGSWSFYDMGSVGYAFSGGVFYDTRASPSGDTAWANEIETLDQCMGHSSANGQYHYHGVPYCMPDDTYSAADPSQCVQVGWMFDGFPIYGMCQHTDGTTLQSCWSANSASASNLDDYTYTNDASCNLDEANGYTFSDGSYGYITTENFSGVPIGLMGDSSEWGTACGFTP